MNNVMAFPTVEAPGAAAADMKVQTDIQSESTESTGFAEKLKDCEGECMKEQPAAVKDGEKKNDNGMPDDPNIVVLYGIAGILEGFEPLSYQTDTTPITEGINTEVTAVAAEPAGKQVYDGTQQTQMQLSSEYTGEMSEEIAWMLQNNETGTKPVQTQDDIMSIVGEYLDSLENTNGKKPQAIMNEVKDTGSVIAEGSSKQADKGLAAGKTAGSPDIKEAVLSELPKNAPQVLGQTADNKTVQSADQNILSKSEIKSVQSDIQTKPELSDKEIGKQEPAARDTAAANIQPEIASRPAANGAADEISAVKEPEKAEAAVTKDNVLRIVDKIRTSASEGKYDFDIELKPDFLGKVSIKLTMEDGSVKVRIKAEDASAKALLSDQTSSLQTMLKEKGIPVTHVDVMYESGTTASFDQARHEYGRNPQRSFYEKTEGNFESAKEMYDFYIGNSAVEFLA